MRIDEAMRGVEVLEWSASGQEVARVQYDSRRVGPGDIFVAMRGETTDGNDYIDRALERGASVVVTDSLKWMRALERMGPGILVAHGRRALAGIASNLLDHPQRKLAISAVTGTNGKTTTAFLLEQMLRSVGRKCILVGTIETRIGDEVRASDHTTPEASDLLQLFADGVAAGCTEVVMEMSSHALAQERVWGVPVDVAMFTNLTQDHLDFHGSMGNYASAKMRLFKGVGTEAPRVSIVNVDDALGEVMAGHASRSGSMVWRYEMKRTHGQGIDCVAEDVTVAAGKTSFEWRTPWGSANMQSPLTGKVNVYNLLAASCAALARGLSLEEIAAAVPNLQQVPGRFQTVANSLGFTVVVDYAHTDDALRNLIVLARELVKDGGGRVMTLFGCGGDRDRSKRPKMGRAAGEGSDIVVLTSDNPRSEEPKTILDEVFTGVKPLPVECHIIEDRREAIEYAIQCGRAGDIVLLAGKGHEKVQISKGKVLPFDDVAVAASVLRRLESGAMQSWDRWILQHGTRLDEELK